MVSVGVGNKLSLTVDSKFDVGSLDMILDCMP